MSIITTGVLTVGLLASPAVAAEPVTDSAPSVTCTLGSVWSRLPADLRTDLKELRDLEPGSERTDAAKAIRDDALAGEYGPGVQKRAEAIQEHGVGATVKLWLLNNCD